MKNNFQSILLVVVFGVFGVVVDADEVKLSVIEGDSFTLHTNITELQTDVQIEWRFNNLIIVEIKQKKYTLKNYTDGRFTSRLQVDDQTGDLSIKNMRIKHSGRYQAEIINNEGTTQKIFTVTVTKPSRVLAVDPCEVKSVPVTEGGPVTLHTDVQTQRDDLIVWRFGLDGVLIAKDDKEDDKSLIYDDKIFRDRLKLEDRTGSLTITNTKTTDTGVYKLKISSNGKNTQKTFSVAVSAKDNSWSSGAIAGIVIAVIAAVAAAAVAVHWYRRSNSLITKVIAVSGQSVTLYTESQIKEGNEIKWVYGDNTCLVAGKKGVNEPKPTEDKRFKDRLEMNPETGDLTIRNSRWTDSGFYTLQQRTRDGKISYRIFQVLVSGTEKNDSTSVEMTPLNAAEDRF